MTLLYTTREGAQWRVTEALALPFLPGFWVGRREGDDRQVVVHEHRCRQENLDGGGATKLSDERPGASTQDP